MKKVFSTIFALCVATTLLTAQDKAIIKPWKTGASLSLTGTSTNLSPYWNAGGTSNIAVNGLVALKAEYNVNKNNWLTTLDLGYGVSKLGRWNEKKSGSWFKNDDRIILVSNYNRQLKERLFLTGTVDFRTQFMPGYTPSKNAAGIVNGRNLVSNLLAPAYLVGGIGLTYKNEAGNFIATLSPIAAKVTFVYDDSLVNVVIPSDAGTIQRGAFGVERGQNIRSQFGANLAIGYSKNLRENVAFKTKANLFMDYKTPTLIDVNWETMLTAKITKNIGVSLATNLIYDDDMKFKILNEETGIATGTLGARTQFSYVFGAGINYIITNTKN